MEVFLWNLLILIGCFLCNSYPCLLFESLSHVISQESHVYSWNLGTSFYSGDFKKVNSVNLAQISHLNVWLLVQIRLFSESKVKHII